MTTNPDSDARPTTDGPTAGAIGPVDDHTLRRRELAGLCTTLAQYDDEDWDHETYCDGWRVRDVVGHMLVGYTTPMGSMLVKVASKRFDVDRASAVESVAYGSSHTPTELLEELRRVERDDVRRGISRMIPASEGVVDHVIHHIDITRPLGRSTTTSPEARQVALDKIVTLGGFVRAKGRAKGLRFVATDLDWSWGSGPTVSGPSEDLLLALSGRVVGLGGLSGDGVPALDSRLG